MLELFPIRELIPVSFIEPIIDWLTPPTLFVLSDMLDRKETMGPPMEDAVEVEEEAGI